MAKNNIAKSIYGGIAVSEGKICVSWLSKNDSDKDDIEYQAIKPGYNVLSSIASWVRQYSKEKNVKFISIGFASANENLKLFSKLWLDLDVVPLQVSPELIPNTSKLQDAAQFAAAYVAEHFDENDSFSAKVGEKNKVETPPLVRLEDYEEITPPDDFKELITLAKQFEGKRMSYFSATPQGGGVAIMRHALLRLFDLLKVNASWHVLDPDPLVFDITKRKFHNILQSVSPQEDILTDKEKKLFEAWSASNAEKFKTVFEESDVIVVDDPQPSGLVPYIQKVNPKSKIVFRSHIQLQADLANKENTPQNVTWSFIWNNIKDIDLFISHPVDEFVPLEVSTEKLLKMPPSTDPLDGLNKELSDEQKSYYMSVFNQILEQQGQKPMNSNHPYIIQIARFDPSKGIPDVLEAYAKLRIKIKSKSLLPQLAIVGNASVDDPDGKPIYDMTMDLINQRYSEFKDDIKVVRAPHYDQLLNTLLRKASIALQLSHKEGFEFKITEAVMKGIPTIIYDSGGMPLQIIHERTGYIVEKGNTDKVAEYMYKLLSDQEIYSKMSISAQQDYYREATTVPNAIKWLRIANEL